MTSRFRETIKTKLLRPFFGAITRLVSLLVESPLPSRWVFMIFAYVLPIASTHVRGITLRTAIPIYHVGIHHAFKHWADREPHVLDWIDRMTPDDVLLDVGSSFGTESLYAAKKPAGPSRILSFDADLAGMFVLAHNLVLNDASNVDMYVIAMTDSTGPMAFATRSNYFGVRDQRQYWDVLYWVQGMRIDDVIAMQPYFPTHIKIDVDGTEDRVVAGMSTTLADRRLKSLLVEVSQVSKEEIVSTLKGAGLVLQDTHQLTGGLENLVFQRTPTIKC
jgi:FkbM family methyltransferase